MKKMGRLSALGLAVVLLVVVLAGCSEPVSSGDPNWTTNEDKNKVWERENSSESYVRAFEQFGNSKNVDEVVAKITVGNMTASKAGLVFGLNQYNADDDNPTYEYFVVGIGGENYGTTPADYYISYYQNVSMASLSESNNSQNANGEMWTIVDNTGFDAFSKTDTAATVYVSAVYGKNDSNEDIVTVTIGNNWTKAGGVTTSNATAVDPVVIKLDAIEDNPNSGTAKTATSTSKTKGGIGAYGMVRPVQGDVAQKTVNAYVVEDFGGAVSLAADAE